MIRSPSAQDALVALLAALVAWACVQLSPALGWPTWASATLGVGIAAALVGWRVRERASTDPVPEFLPFRVTPAGLAWAAAALVVVALALRLFTLLERPTWEDEMWTLRNFFTASWWELLVVAFDDYWPPLHYLILNALARVGDTSLLWMRMPSVIFGVAAVALMIPLGRELLESRAAALAGAALLAGMTTHVLYSQEARVYSLQVLLAVWSATTFFRSYRQRRISPWFVLSTVLLTWSHSFASWYFVSAECAFVAVAWLLWRDGRAFRKAFLSQLIVLLAWMPLVAGFLWQRSVRQARIPTNWATGIDETPGLLDVVEQVQSLVVRSWAGAAFTGLLVGLAAWVLFRSLSSGSIPADREGDEGTPVPRRSLALVFLFCWATVPLLFSWCVTTFTSLNTFGGTRYHLAVVPGLCLLMVAGLAAVRSRAGLSAAALLLVLLPLGQLPRHYRNFGWDRPAMDAAAEIVRAMGSPDERVYVGLSFRAFAYYYRGVFPRIGSAQFDSLVASTADGAGKPTMGSGRLGDDYAYEKIPEAIRYFGFYGGPDRYRRFIADELADGAFRDSFWLVLRQDGTSAARSLEFQATLLEAGVECEGAIDYHVRNAIVRHCGVGAADRVSSTTW